jgi:hypothetical protein
MAGQDFRPADVMRAMREVMGELGEGAALNFKENTYSDANGQRRPMIEFSEDVVIPVVGRVGGARHQGCGGDGLK